MRECPLKLYLDCLEGREGQCRVWASFKLTDSELIIALSQQLRAPCWLIYPAVVQSRCITIIWNTCSIYLPKGSLSYSHLVQYHSGQWMLSHHLPLSSIRGHWGRTWDLYLQCSQLIRKGLLQLFIPALRQGYFWGTVSSPAKITHLQCENCLGPPLQLRRE